MGCPIVGARRNNRRKCLGYELTKPLDFHNPASYASGSVNPKWTEGSGWLPIGYSGQNGGYEAILDGNGYTISNLSINRTTGKDDPGSTGLFARTERKAQIMRTGLDKINVTGRNSVGALVAASHGTIFGSHVTGSVAGANFVGGLAGPAGGRTSGSYTAGSVVGTKNVGGLAGSNRSRIIGSYATGSVSGTKNVGGLARAIVYRQYVRHR